jgi:hypothetical protein
LPAAVDVEAAVDEPGRDQVHTGRRELEREVLDLRRLWAGAAGT